ncbi:hypothetical protein CoNPh17_CDS0072 [Staphylococcus phage S-CoN_Ph17]|nr:hypothetical protein CoNPh17_CDS0072 [Staphylococcus phage S-CoN_Ph17]
MIFYFQCNSFAFHKKFTIFYVIINLSYYHI